MPLALTLTYMPLPAIKPGTLLSVADAPPLSQSGQATQVSDSVLAPPHRILSDMYALRVPLLRMSGTDSDFRHVSYSVGNYITHLAIYSFDFIALGKHLKI